MLEDVFYDKLERLSVQAGKRDHILAAHVQRTCKTHDTIIRSYYQRIKDITNSVGPPRARERGRKRERKRARGERGRGRSNERERLSSRAWASKRASKRESVRERERVRKRDVTCGSVRHTVCVCVCVCVSMYACTCVCVCVRHVDTHIFLMTARKSFLLRIMISLRNHNSSWYTC